jgi:hypothetical protein
LATELCPLFPLYHASAIPRCFSLSLPL